MRVRGLIGLALLPTLCGCAELATGLMMVADEMEAENGTWYENESHTDRIGTDYCPGTADYGRVNNQTYARVTNYAQTTMYTTIHWNTGLQSDFALSPGESSQYIYFSPSIWPSSTTTQCD
ncbi:hypothetical protein [Brevundimonas sp.]|uniref:hypothetical protein n=1 Tax=Brevundimonas sp. TaxID=1871086 RepID=UPI002ABA2CFE|nr:hypothetical protein [Brevundimonas sp.]MDZ4363414.1 hypothetical protein [Brevundimonas sp.]